MSFTDEKPFRVSQQDIHLPWSGGKGGKYFRCYLCGHKFQAGNIARWQYTNDIPGAGGNPMVCEKCDGTKEQIIAKWKQMHTEAKEKMWYFNRRENQ